LGSPRSRYFGDYLDSGRESTGCHRGSGENLAADPLGYGVAVSEGLYAVEAHPLRALFEIAETEKSVTVVSVAELA
jgi:hypothetical protein